MGKVTGADPGDRNQVGGGSWVQRLKMGTQRNGSGVFKPFVCISRSLLKSLDICSPQASGKGKTKQKNTFFLARIASQHCGKKCRLAIIYISVENHSHIPDTIFQELKDFSGLGSLGWAG